MTRALLIAAAYAALAFVVYGPSLGGDWVYDDHRFIARNDAIDLKNTVRFFHDPTTVDPEGNWEGIYRPLRSVSFAIDAALFDRNPVGYRIHALLSHAAAAFAVAVLLGRILRRRRVGWVLGALWLVLPVHVESVAWVTSRSDVECALASLVALIAWRSGRPWIGVGALVIALLMKEQAVVVPGIAFVLDVLVPPARRPVVAVRRAIVPAAVVIAYLGVRTVVLGDFGDQRDPWPGNLAATMTLGVLWYAMRIAAPVDFRFDWQMPSADGWGAAVTGHDVPIAPWLGAIVLVAVVASVFVARRSWRVGVAGVVWFGIALAPMLNLVPINILVAERFLYLPSVGALLAVGAIWCGVGVRARRVLLVALVCWGAYGASTTARFAGHFHTERALWNGVVAHSPSHYRGWVGIAKAHILAGDLDAGRAALRRAIALSGGRYGHLYYDLGRTYLLSGDHERAVPYLRDAVIRWRAEGRGRSDRRFVATLRQLAIAARNAGDRRQADTFDAWLAEALARP